MHRLNESDSHLCTLSYVAHFRNFDTFGVARRNIRNEEKVRRRKIKSLCACFGLLIISWFQSNNNRYFEVLYIFSVQVFFLFPILSINNFRNSTRNWESTILNIKLKIIKKKNKTISKSVGNLSQNVDIKIKRNYWWWHV